MVAAELAKMLALVAPVTMSSDQQTAWLAAAIDALEGIRPDEVAHVSLEVRRTVTRPSQIVPEIAGLVAELRADADDERSRTIRRQIEHEAETIPPPKKHVADRDRRNFGPDDWAELNEYLASMGSVVRYGADGTKYPQGFSA